ncbi:MAG: DUF2064 domain-containing protein [Thermoanaerobaculia bacterium]
MSRTTRDLPTLLVLTRAPRHERERKRLLPEALADAERRLYEKSLADVVACGKRTGCRVVVSSPSRLEIEGVHQLTQRGDTFGDRFANSVSLAQLKWPGGPLVVVGTDTPELGARHLEETLDHLRRDPDEVVLGPSVDGGFYLLAWARPLRKVDWLSVSWCSLRTRETLRRCLEAAGRSVQFLEPEADLDRAPDLERWLAAATGTWRRRLSELRRILLGRLRVPVPAELPALAGCTPIALRDRAPPR